jgi:anti-sigma factor (TIGR02949 family)
MTCKDVIAILGDYLEGAVPEESLQRFEEHLRDCPPCVAYLNTYKRTRELAAAAARVEMPEEMKRRLREFLLVELRNTRR